MKMTCYLMGIDSFQQHQGLVTQPASFASVQAQGGPPKGGPPKMSGLNGPPSPAFYECVLVLESDKGA